MPSHPDRVRDETPKVAACIRLGHAWQLVENAQTLGGRLERCIRCRLLSFDGHEYRPQDEAQA